MSERQGSRARPAETLPGCDGQCRSLPADGVKLTQSYLALVRQPSSQLVYHCVGHTWHLNSQRSISPCSREQGHSRSKARNGSVPASAGCMRQNAQLVTYYENSTGRAWPGESESRV